MFNAEASFTCNSCICIAGRISAANIIEKSKLAVLSPESTVRKFRTDVLKAKPKLLIDCLIKEFVLYDDKIQIYFHSPIKLSPDNSRGFTFYTEDIKITYKNPHRSDRYGFKYNLQWKYSR